MQRYSTTYHENQSQTALVITDDGNGGLRWGNTPLVGASVNYATGEIVIPKEPLKQRIAQPQYSPYQITQGAYATTLADTKVIQTLDVQLLAPKQATVFAVVAGDTRTVNQTVQTGLLTYELLADLPLPHAVIFNSWLLEINGKQTIERDGVLYQDWNELDGTGKVVGSLNAAGLLQLNGIQTATPPVVKVLQGVYVNGQYEVQSFHGRTAAAPIKPQSFTAYAEVGGETLQGKAQADETLSGSLKGKIESATGYFSIEAPQPISPDSLRYNAVSQNSVPLDSSVIGINSARLPADGFVPVLRKGDMVVISNKHTQNIGSAFTANQVIDLERKNLDRLCLIDNQGKHVLAEQYDYDLDAGSITFGDNLSLAGYEMPLFAVQIWEEANRLVDTDISGSLKLQTPLSRDYPVENTYVSSAIIGGDLQVRATEPFTQNTWTNVWQDTRIGDDVLLKLNVKDHPIELTSDGAISERWLIVFTSQTQFRLIGERLGVVAESDVLVDLAPINPATEKPYFRLPLAAFGAVKWNPGNCIRFNTTGAQMPVWILRAVQPSADKGSKQDRFTLCLRGDTVETA